MADIADRASEYEERHRAAALAAQLARAAPARLVAGPLRADCADCGDPIHPLRLVAVPQARRCAGCQALTEAGHVV